MYTKIKAFDFTRVICTLGILCFHYSCHTNGSFKPLYLYANGDWGTVFVTVFFILSGGLLYCNNAADDFILRKFYYKRWKSIFPSFYICWIGFYILSVLQYKSFTLHKPAINILYSIMGIDGYLKLAYGLETFYFIGEWFLGAIIISYIFMPILIRFSKKYDLLVGICLFILLIGSIYIDLFKVDIPRNILTCLFCMELGIVILKRELWKNKFMFVMSLLITLVFSFQTLPANIGVLYIVLGVALFMVLSYIGNYIMEVKNISNSISKISNISYEIYLLHHVIVIAVLKILDILKVTFPFFSLFLIISITIVAGWILEKITFIILNMQWYKKLENKIVYKRLTIKSQV